MSQHLNYHHLFYFRTIAREGSIAEAAQKLRLSQPTLSAQLKTLEEVLEIKLFERKNRRLILTETGKMALQYAEEIFSLGEEFMTSLKEGPRFSKPSIKIGVIDSFPKILTYRFIRTLLHFDVEVTVSCIEGKQEELVTKLATHDVDLVLSDCPVPNNLPIQAYSHLLGESTVSLFGCKELVKRTQDDFPYSLKHVPVLLPTKNTALRREIDRWLTSLEIFPNVKAELEDSALMKVLASHSEGVVFLPTAVAEDVEKDVGLTMITEIPTIIERVYLLTLEKKVKDPIASALFQKAREHLAFENGKG